MSYLKKKQGMLKQEPGIFLSYEVLLNYDKKISWKQKPSFTYAA